MTFILATMLKPLLLVGLFLFAAIAGKVILSKLPPGKLRRILGYTWKV
jgi:hypothetical protein